MRHQVLNSKGDPILLNEAEQHNSDYVAQQIRNSNFGIEVDVTTLTTIIKSITEQKFFQVAPAKYMPVVVGEGAWSVELLKYREFSTGDDFETGIMNTAADNSRLSEVDAAVDPIKVPVINWAKAITWSIFDLKHASQAGNWDLVSSKERSRKKNWDLGIQKIAFFGMNARADVNGLLTQTDVTSNTTLITKTISSMTDTEFETFVAGVVGAYRTNCAFTAMPSRFIIPELDYNGLAVSVDENFGLKSKLQRLLEAFRLITQNDKFEILPLAYADQANNADITGLNKNRYVLMNHDEDSVRMDIPVDYTSTLQNTLNGVQFQNGAYGQFTGVKAYRPKEMLYFDWAA